MKWKVNFTSKSAKQVSKLSENIQLRLSVLIEELKVDGPVRGNWKNYGKLGKTKHHCHIKSGKPTYVVCWEVTDKEIKVLEVYYVGTHEKAPY